MGLLVFFVLLAILSSFAASLMEGTLLSISFSYIQSLINNGRKSGAILWELKKNIDRPLSAILSFDTIASVVGATGAGVQAELMFDSVGIGVFTGVFTFASLIFAEIIPKTIGAIYWRKTAVFTGYAVKSIMFLMYPVTLLTNTVTRVIAPKEDPNACILREEIAIMAQIGADTGALSGWEEEILRNLLGLHKLSVSRIITPRTVITAFPNNMTMEEVLNNENLLPFSRIPVYSGNIDRIEGVVLRHDILKAIADQKHHDTLKTVMRPIHSIPASLSVAEVLRLFINRKEHMFVVLDEYGGTQGIITLEDAVEALLGLEIVDEKDIIVNMQEIAQIRKQIREMERDHYKNSKETSL